MRIQDAIDGLGPEGKLRKPWWEEGLYCTVDGNCLQFHFPVQPAHSPQVPISIVEYLYKSSRDDDWEVVPEERIEVNDVVEKDPCVSSRSGCHVLAIEKVGSCVIYALHQRERACACVAQPDNRLTLIRKGEKVLWDDVIQGSVVNVEKDGPAYCLDRTKEHRLIIKELP